MWTARFLLRIALITVLPATSLQAVGADEATNAQVEAEVRAALTDFGERIDASDWEGSLAFYSDDPRFYWVEVGRQIYESKQQVAEGLQGAYEMVEDIEFIGGDPRITVLTPTLAFVTVTSETRMTFRGGHVVEIPSVLSAVLQKSERGWQFLAGQSAAESLSSE